MMIDVRHQNGEVSDAMHEFTYRRVAQVLELFEHSVSRVDVSTTYIEQCECATLLPYAAGDDQG